MSRVVKSLSIRGGKGVNHLRSLSLTGRLVLFPCLPTTGNIRVTGSPGVHGRLTDLGVGTKPSVNPRLTRNSIDDSGPNEQERGLGVETLIYPSPLQPGCVSTLYVLRLTDVHSSSRVEILETKYGGHPVSSLFRHCCHGWKFHLLLQSGSPCPLRVFTRPE